MNAFVTEPHLMVRSLRSQEVLHSFSHLAWVLFTFNEVPHGLNSKCSIGHLEQTTR